MHAAIMSSTYEQSVAPIELSAEGCMTLTSPNIPPIAGHPSLEKGKAPVAAQRTPRAALAPKPQFCIVEGCQKPLTSVYLARCRLCPDHLRAPELIIKGERKRFCQKCSNMHPISAFDGAKRSCRLALQRHNAKQRLMRQLRGRDSGKGICTPVSKHPGVVSSSLHPHPAASPVTDAQLSLLLDSVNDVDGYSTMSSESELVADTVTVTKQQQQQRPSRGVTSGGTAPDTTTTTTTMTTTTTTMTTSAQAMATIPIVLPVTQFSPFLTSSSPFSLPPPSPPLTNTVSEASDAMIESSIDIALLDLSWDDWEYLLPDPHDVAALPPVVQLPEGVVL